MITHRDIRIATQELVHSDSPPLQDLNGSLQLLPWDSPDEAQVGAIKLVETFANEYDIAEVLHSLGPEAKIAFGANARETGTHMKWLLVDDPDDRYKVWLHEFKDSTLPEPGASRSIHNHRYGFGALILRGGYLHQKYGSFDHSSEDEVVDRIKLRSGDAYKLDSDEIHSLDEVEEGTLSIVVQGPSDSDRSMSVAGNTTFTHIHPEAICKSYDWLR